MPEQNNATDHDEPTPLVSGTKAKEEEKDFGLMPLKVCHPYVMCKVHFPKMAVERVVARVLDAEQ